MRLRGHPGLRAKGGLTVEDLGARYSGRLDTLSNFSLVSIDPCLTFARGRSASAPAAAYTEANARRRCGGSQTSEHALLPEQPDQEETATSLPKSLQRVHRDEQAGSELDEPRPTAGMAAPVLSLSAGVSVRKAGADMSEACGTRARAKTGRRDDVSSPAVGG